MNLQEQTFELLEKTGLNWSVTKEALTAGEKTTESFGMFRGDSWLGTVSSRYEPFQNSELAEMMIAAAEGIDLEVTRGGMLKDGAKVYLQASLPDEFIGRSKVARWITGVNSHDGSTSIGFGSTNTTIICQNTFFRAYGELEKVRHTASAKDRVETMIRNMRRTMELDYALMDSFKRMADKPLIEELFAKVTAKLFDITDKTKNDELSTRKSNLIGHFGSSVEQSVREQGSTIWALFNGITRYTNHVVPNGQERIMNGVGAFANKGYDEIMKYITENTAEYVAV